MAPQLEHLKADVSEHLKEHLKAEVSGHLKEHLMEQELVHLKAEMLVQVLVQVWVDWHRCNSPCEALVRRCIRGQVRYRVENCLCCRA